MQSSIAQPMSDDEPDPMERLADALADGTGLDLGKAMHAARVALRWHDRRMRKDAELHCRSMLALMRYSTRYEDLHSSQQNAVNREVSAVINVFDGRMTDHSFLYLGHDQREALQPERQIKPCGRIQ